MGEISENTAARLFDLLGDVQQRSIRTEEQTKTMAATLARIDHTVHGNGEAGLDERVRNLEANQRRATGLVVKLIQWALPAALTLTAAGAMVWLKDSLGLTEAPPAKTGQQQAQGDVSDGNTTPSPIPR